MNPKYNVVIIEDDRIISEVLKNKINELASFSVVNTYENPMLFLTDNIKFDIILLDIVMPEMNGLDAIEPIL